HGWDAGQRLSDLTFTDDGSNTLHFTAPTNRAVYTPGYYMLFYVDGNGVPSVAKMVRLEG
ncbi:MAG: galactose oxidase early set domain-containing protein, partial [Candidatus Tectomicrobia bacterium]